MVYCVSYGRFCFLWEVLFLVGGSVSCFSRVTNHDSFDSVAIVSHINQQESTVKPRRLVQPLLLAGGHSSRFGSNKALHRWRGRALVDHVLDVLRLVFDPPEIWVGVARVGADTKLLEVLGQHDDLVFVEDAPEVMGPMASLLAGARAGAMRGIDGLFVCGCDMPGLRLQLVSRMASQFGVRTSGTSALIPRVSTPTGRRVFEPLHAFYDCEEIQQQLSLYLGAQDTALNTQGKLQRFIRALDRVDIVEEPALQALDPLWKASLTNVNTPSELEALEMLLERAL